MDIFFNFLSPSVNFHRYQQEAAACSNVGALFCVMNVGISRVLSGLLKINGLIYVNFTAD
jgi:hypothetical protein